MRIVKSILLLAIMVISNNSLAQGIPYFEDFESNLSVWEVEGWNGYNPSIVTSPVINGNQAVSVPAGGGINNWSRIKYFFADQNELNASVWFYMTEYGLNDSPGSYGHGSPGSVELCNSESGYHLYICGSADGRVRWIPGGTSNGHDYDNFISDIQLELESWYKYNITHKGDSLWIQVLDLNEQVIIDYDTTTNYSYNIDSIYLGSYNLAGEGTSYFDDFLVTNEVGQQIPFSDDFENDLSSWEVESLNGYYSEIAASIFYSGAQSVEINAGPGINNWSRIKYDFPYQNQVMVTTWFNMSEFGLPDSPGSYGHGSPGSVELVSSGNGYHLYICSNEDGRIRWIPGGTPDGHDYDNYISDIHLDLNTWYKYKIVLIDSILCIQVFDDQDDMIINYETSLEYDYDIDAIYLAAYNLDSNGATYFDDFEVTNEIEHNDIVVTEDFEDDLSAWIIESRNNYIPELVNNPVFHGNQAVAINAGSGINNWSRIEHHFSYQNEIQMSTWFYMDQYGMTDSPSSHGHGSPGTVELANSDNGFHLYICGSNDGRVRWIPGGTGNGHDYDNYISDIQLDLNTWYKYKIVLKGDSLWIDVIDTETNVIIDYDTTITYNYDINRVYLAAYNLIADGATYFDNFDIQLMSDVEEDIALSPIINSFDIVKTYPNPFNSSLNIVVDVNKKTNLELSTYNILGQNVGRIFAGIVQPGNHLYNFNGKNLSTGVYFVKVSSSDHGHSTRRVVLIK